MYETSGTIPLGVSELCATLFGKTRSCRPAVCNEPLRVYEALSWFVMFI